MQYPLGLGRLRSQNWHPFSLFVAGTMAALLAVAAASYMLLVLGTGVGHLLGRVFIFVPGFVALLAVGCAAGTVTRGALQRAFLFAMAATGLGALGFLWIWINLFTFETAVLLLSAGGLASVATATAVMRAPRRPTASLYAAIGGSGALVILGLGLSISIAPACGPAGSSFHIDKWSPPAATVSACRDGRLSFDFFN